MKKNYERIIDVMLGILFVMLLYGFSQAIIFLDNSMGYFGSNQAFANTILENDKYLIGLVGTSIVLTIIYAICDFFSFKFRRRIQFGLGVLMMVIAAYLFIVVCGLRNQAYSIESYSTQTAFTLYTEYRQFSLLIVFSQFLLSLHALVRGIYQFIMVRKGKDKENNQEE